MVILVLIWEGRRNGVRSSQEGAGNGSNVNGSTIMHEELRHEMMVSSQSLDLFCHDAPCEYYLLHFQGQAGHEV